MVLPVKLKIMPSTTTPNRYVPLSLFSTTVSVRWTIPVRERIIAKRVGIYML
jgi:hypothetical protein